MRDAAFIADISGTTRSPTLAAGLHNNGLRVHPVHWPMPFQTPFVLAGLPWIPTRPDVPKVNFQVEDST
jgi:hypothetical protein